MKNMKKQIHVKGKTYKGKILKPKQTNALVVLKYNNISFWENKEFSMVENYIKKQLKNLQEYKKSKLYYSNTYKITLYK